MLKSLILSSGVPAGEGVVRLATRDYTNTSTCGNIIHALLYHKHAWLNCSSPVGSDMWSSTVLSSDDLDIMRSSISKKTSSFLS